jgi:hypothetical protein
MMTTSLDSTEGSGGTAGIMHATKTQDDLTNTDGTYQQISYKMYVYENPYVSTANGEAKHPTRVIIAGTYTPDLNKPTETKRAYYPIDIVEGGEDDLATEGVDERTNYRPVIRNYKYEFKVVGVTGPGYNSIEDAGNGAAVHLNVDVLAWNKEDVKIGVRGKYYATMNEKSVELWRNADNSKTLNLSYNILDEYTTPSFELNFAPSVQDNGEQSSELPKEPEEADKIGIKNDYFQIEMVHTEGEVEGTGTVEFIVTALKEYTADHDAQIVEVKFRDIRFEIDITQLQKAEDDWIDGQDQPWDAGKSDEED